MSQRKNTKPGVLLVEDDIIFRRLISRNLVRNNFEVSEADNGKMALSMIDKRAEPFDLIISDIRMPEMDGVALLQHVRKNSTVPFIVMTGFSEILECKDAYQLGASAFLPKPLRSQALLETIQDCLYPKDKIPVSARPALVEFLRIHIDEFLASPNLLSDIYICLGEDHYVKIAHKGEAISLDRLESYRSSKVSHLYVTAADFREYANFHLKLADELVKSTKVGNEKKVSVLQHTAEILLRAAILGDMEKEVVQAAGKMVTSATELIGENQQALQYLTNMSQGVKTLYSQSVIVSTLAALIAQNFGWCSATSLHKVAVCGLFHDLGKLELPQELVFRKRSELTADDIRRIETHPVRGRDVLLQIPGMPEEVSQVAFEHHEKMDGTGYPRGISGEAIHPIARLIHIADRFVNYVMPINEGAPKLSPEDALSKLWSVHIDEVDPNFLSCLSQLFKFKKSA